MPGKVMLVDDHELFVEGLRYLLKTKGISVVGTARNGREALEQARLLKPDIILMDIAMPGCGGLEALCMLKSQLPDIKVVMLTASDEDEDLFRAVKLGASGYLLKNTGAEELVAMLAKLEKEEAPLSPGLAARLLREFRRNGAVDNPAAQKTVARQPEEPLTQRQIEVLEMVAAGMTYKEVGTAIGITERTVKYHMGRIIEQLQLEKRSQAIAYAARIGVVET